MSAGLRTRFRAVDDARFIPRYGSLPDRRDLPGLHTYSVDVAQREVDRTVHAPLRPDERVCGEWYRVTSRRRGGPFHFRAMRMDTGLGANVRITGHWRSGDWHPGETLELRRRKGCRLAIMGAQMELAPNEMIERRGRRTLLVPENRSL